ncbi:UDP-glucuronate 5'-epimerase (EC [Olavius algarvensis associated proteobacterium Delta 3]|nr:UDP-glucuronate 5'-epimerase (EC [Olavius algarvensis associated proteobacterium Delta 3]CAB5123956.1 UDP-glucuronate 5'-epimerase (EC [Olavius algarvensis associated proteobacterium Delta 3]
MDQHDPTILVTGVAGFIGYHVAERLLKDGRRVVGIDNVNPYYDTRLKEARLERLAKGPEFTFHRIDLSDRQGIHRVYEDHSIDRVVHLAAQAGVRHSLKNPYAYAESNLTGFLNVLEGCRHHSVEHLVFASSSSVYGANTRMPFSVHHNVDHPVSLYAASKKANELMAHSYAHLYGMSCTGLRFFTVYGPWGRPDMALFLFTRAIMEGKPIQVFNEGNMLRDFTYIDDIVEGVVRTMDRKATANPAWSGETPDPGTSYSNYRIYNIGNNHPVSLMHFIETLEDVLGMKAQKEFLPLQAGDVVATYADIDDLVRDVGFRPGTPLRTGIERFVDWFKDYYGYNV